MAAAGFRLRSIKTSLTLGDKLARARSKKRVTLAQAEEATKIRAKYLRAIERGEYDCLPTGAYARCFVFTYGRYLGLPESALAVDWQKEAKLAPTAPAIATESSVHLSHFQITPRLVIGAAALLSGFMILGYVLFQVGRLTGGPDLVITSPDERAVVADSSVAGQTAKGASVTINGQAIRPDTEGKFAEKVGVDPGLNSIEVVATGVSGKQSRFLLLIERTEKTVGALLDSGSVK